MQSAAIKFTRNDLAKYPFLKETSEYVKSLDLKTDDIVNSSFSEVLNRAQHRIEDAIVRSLVPRNLSETEVEIMSFPVAMMMTMATENSFIKKRYALAEAKQAFQDLQAEISREKLLAIARNFGWSLEVADNPAIQCEFSLNFEAYVKNTTYLKDNKWKIVNRPMVEGKVYLARAEVARLLSEEVRIQIEKRLESNEEAHFPKVIVEIAEKIKQLSMEKIGKTELEGFPQVIVQPAFPPCINALYEAFTSGRHLSHIGRFTLTSFLVNIGMPSEKVIELFRSVSDFNERMTRYQVEHIAGEKGSRTRYAPPRCSTLKTHGVCINPDQLCQRVHHPLNYYRRRLRTVPKTS